MQIFKVIGATLGAVGQTVQDTAQLGSIIVGDNGLKHTTIQSFALVNTALDESVLIAKAESEFNIAEFKRTHAIKKAGRPKKSSANAS